MRKLLCIILSLSLILCSCTKPETIPDNKNNTTPSITLSPTDITDIPNDEESSEALNPTNEVEPKSITEPTGLVQPTELISPEPTPVLEDEDGYEDDDDFVIIDDSLNIGCPIVFRKPIIDCISLDDQSLLNYLENEIQIDPEFAEKFTVDGITVGYLSKEYLEEVAYNTKSNIFFGYTLAELDDAFEGKKYVFTLDDGKTVVREFENYDDTFEKILKNVVIGTGVILICVTISAVSGGLGSPVVSAIFAASAKSATELAISTAVINSAITAVTIGIETKDFEQTMKAALLSASEGFKFGAIFGAISGGAVEGIKIKIASSGGIPAADVVKIFDQHNKIPPRFLKQLKSLEEFEEIVNEAERLHITIEELASIQLATKYPIDIIKCLKSVEENKIYCEEAKLYVLKVKDSWALVRDIDLDFKSITSDGRILTNIERMREGKAAIDPLTGKAYQLHHIGQQIDSPLAILTQAEHQSSKNYSILHDVNITPGSGVHSLDPNWPNKKRAFWKAYAKLFDTGVIS